MEGGVSVSLLGAGAVLFGLWDPHPPPPLLSHSLGKADEVLVVGVDVGELNVDQQQDLGGVGGSVGGWELWDYGGGVWDSGWGQFGIGSAKLWDCGLGPRGGRIWGWE